MHRKTDWSENRKDDKGEMSFSGMVKEELSRQIGLARHCKMAELAAILCSCGKMECFSGDTKLKIQTENEAVARKCFTLLQKTFNIETDVSNSRIDCFRKGNLYCISIIDQVLVKEILDFLEIRPGQQGLDCTLGYGGHSRKMLEKLEGEGRLVGLDIDPIESENTVKRLRAAGFSEDTFQFRLMNFANID